MPLRQFHCHLYLEVSKYYLKAMKEEQGTELKGFVLQKITVYKLFEVRIQVTSEYAVCRTYNRKSCI